MNFPDPPRGLNKIPWRMPILLYRIGLGWLFGSRALLLTHTGRKSGKTRQNVLEVIHKSKNNQIFTVVSGFGPKSDWYKNISLKPEVYIQVSLKKMAATAHLLDSDQKEKIFFDYINKHPQGFRFLANLVGYKIEHTPEGYSEFARQIPIIQFIADEPY